MEEPLRQTIWKGEAAIKKSNHKSSKVDPPTIFKPQLATLTSEAPVGKDWFHEIKFDGYRMGCRVQKGKAMFLSRGGEDWTARLPQLAAEAASLPLKSAFLDGEVVALEKDGTTSFQALQNVFRERKAAALQYFVFDLLHLDGRDMTSLPLEERKAALADILKQTKKRKGRLIQYSEHFTERGATIFEKACEQGLEGIISKRRDLPYTAGRGHSWLKVKCVKHEEFVIGGFTDPGGARKGFGSLLIGYHDKKGSLIYAGRVGTGFSTKLLAQMQAEMSKLEQQKSPFANLLSKTGVARRAHWIKPKLVAMISFSNWTDDGRLRHPAFLGLREDKPAREVVRDRAEPVETAVAAAKAEAKRKPATKKAKR